LTLKRGVYSVEHFTYGFVRNTRGREENILKFECNTAAEIFLGELVLNIEESEKDPDSIF
jgi:hypothetical protein